MAMRLFLVLAIFASAAPAVALDFQVSAPDALAAVAGRIASIDPRPIEQALVTAGLRPLARVRVTLIPEEDPRARATARWIVALAFGTDDVVIFPARVGSYPYDSLEAVVTHELAHLALTSNARDAPLPRWFHEGVAVSVESGWGLLADARLLLAAIARPGLDDLGRLFASNSQQQSAEAYLLAAAVIADVRERRGAAVPGRIATRVGEGVPFPQAFELETGETPDDAASRAWAGYRRWTAWLPIVTDGSALWTGILALAFIAFVVQRRKRARRRRQWDDEDQDPTNPSRLFL
jgi:hypothetical protein